jgi:hypothetical protein
VNSATDILISLGLLASVAWLVLLVLQLSDLSASLLDVRGAHETGKPGRPARRRYSEYFWTIPLAILTVILLAVGVHVAAVYAAYAVFNAALIIIVLVAVTLAVGIAVVIAFTRGERYSYGQLRANLAGDFGQRLTAAQVALFRSQLEEIDGRRRRIHLGFRDRANVAWLRSELDDLADSFRVVPPTGLAAVSEVRLRTAHTYLWKGNVIRLAPAAVALFAFLCFGIGFIITLATGGPEASFGWYAYEPLRDTMYSPFAVSSDMSMALNSGMSFWLIESLLAPFALFSLLCAVISYLLAIPSARFALAAKVVWHAVNQKQRADAVDQIEEFERSSRKGVTGLGDRVARALQILRDQQGDTTNSR